MLGRVWVVVVAVTAIVAICLLAVRSISTIDLGYHLAYGEQLLETGQVVDHNPYVYTLPPRDLPLLARPAPGPGSWYDQDGRYRFPNANWLSQALLAATYKIGGMVGLSVLGVVTVGGIAVLLLWTMRRLEVAWPAAALGVVLFGVVGYSRLNLRPELFGYLVLIAQACVLAKAMKDPSGRNTISWFAVVALIGLQGLFVNLHSYFVLGLALSGAVFVDFILRWMWVQVLSAEADDTGPLDRTILRLGVLVVGQVLICFANPWTWRLAVLPVETIYYLDLNKIGGKPGLHPWSHILEFRETIRPHFHGYMKNILSLNSKISDYGILTVLVLAVVGGVAALWRGRWGFALLIVFMIFVGLGMKRNVASMALLIVPVSLAVLVPLMSLTAGRWRRFLAFASAYLVVALSVCFAFGVVTNRFYAQEKQPMRFGMGISRAYLPVGAAEWLDTHMPGARIWCDMSSSSTLHFFTRPHREVPIISNTWAYPPVIMARAQEFRGADSIYFDQYAQSANIDVVVLRYDWSPGLYQTLVMHRRWLLAHVEGVHVVLLNPRGERLARARQLAIDPRKFDWDEYIRQQRLVDPLVESSLVTVGSSLQKGGYPELAIAILEAAVQEKPDIWMAWSNLGIGYLGRCRRLHDAADPAYEQAYDAAKRCIERAIKLNPATISRLMKLLEYERNRQEGKL